MNTTTLHLSIYLFMWYLRFYSSQHRSEEVKESAFFADTNWDDVLGKKVTYMYTTCIARVLVRGKSFPKIFLKCVENCSGSNCGTGLFPPVEATPHTA